VGFVKSALLIFSTDNSILFMTINNTCTFRQVLESSM